MKTKISETNSQNSQNQSRSWSIMMKKIILSTFLALLTGLGFAYYLYNKPHQGISDETPAFSLNAETLVSEYDRDEKKANSKYLGKIVEVMGVIAEKTKDKKGNFNVTLQGPDLAGIGCEFEQKLQDKLTSLKEGQKVKIKGICTGVLMDVVLVDCVIENVD
jgi:hypothetical protein